jgi:hypothetical protein
MGMDRELMSVAYPPITILSNSQSVPLDIGTQPFAHLEIYNQCGFVVLVSGLNNGSFYLSPGQDRIISFKFGSNSPTVSGVNNGTQTGQLLLTGYTMHEPVIPLGVAGSVSTITAGTIDANVLGGAIGVSSLPNVVLASQTVTVQALSSADQIGIADAVAPSNSINGFDLTTASQTLFNGPGILRLVSWSGLTGTLSMSLSGTQFLTSTIASDKDRLDLYVPSGDSITATSTTAAGLLLATTTTL